MSFPNVFSSDAAPVSILACRCGFFVAFSGLAALVGFFMGSLPFESVLGQQPATYFQPITSPGYWFWDTWFTPGQGQQPSAIVDLLIVLVFGQAGASAF